MTDTPAVPALETLPRDIRAFVNDKGVSVPRDATALDAVRAHDASLALSIVAGQSRITDSRGLPLPADTVISGGTILRVLPVRELASEELS